MCAEKTDCRSVPPEPGPFPASLLLYNMVQEQTVIFVHVQLRLDAERLPGHVGLCILTAAHLQLSHKDVPGSLQDLEHDVGL